jgi:hypothetical protein
MLNVDTSTVRKTLGALLVVEADFDAFCIDHYRHIYRRFSSGMDRVAKENLLLTLVSPDELMARLKSIDPAVATLQASTSISNPGLPASGASTHTVQPPRAPYDKKWYVVRPDEETQSLDALDYNKPVVLFGPELCGKTWLLHSVITAARERGAQVVTINLNLIDKSARGTLETFLFKFALRIFKELHLDEAEVERTFSRARGGSVDALNDLMSWTVLSSIKERLVLAIDNVDLIADQPYQDEFFGMLRAWVDTGGFERLHLVLAISTAPALLVKDVHRSPFNLGDVLSIPDFNERQLAALAGLHGLSGQNQGLARLRALVGGHPYLTRLAFYEAHRRSLDPVALLDRIEEDPQGGIFAGYLDHLMRKLRAESGLLEAFRRLVHTPSAPLDANLGYRLERAGLVVRDYNAPGQQYKLRYRLYQRLGRL